MNFGQFAMHDKRYPGLDVNPIRDEYEFEYLSGQTILKLCEAGFRSFRDVQKTSLDELCSQACLSEAECLEITSMLQRFLRP